MHVWIGYVVQEYESGNLTFDGEVKAAQSISRQRVSATLEHHSTGLVHLHHFGHDLQDIQKQEIFKTQISLLIKTSMVWHFFFFFF